MKSDSYQAIYFIADHYDAILPTKATAGSAGFDLFAFSDCIVPKRGVKMIETQVKVLLPIGCYGRIAPRSGWAVNHSIDVGGGVIDRDYEGTIKVILFNHADEDFEIKRGYRIAQFVAEKIHDYQDVGTTGIVGDMIDQIREDRLEEINQWKRKANGFGSTGN